MSLGHVDELVQIALQYRGFSGWCRRLDQSTVMIGYCMQLQLASGAIRRDRDSHCRRNTRTESSLPVPSYAIFPLRFLTKTSAPARTASSMRRRSFRRAASWSKDAPEPSSRYDRLMNRTRGDSSRLKRAGDGGVFRGERMYVRSREQYEALRNARESVKYEK